MRSLLKKKVEIYQFVLIYKMSVFLYGIYQCGVTSQVFRSLLRTKWINWQEVVNSETSVFKEVLSVDLSRGGSGRGRGWQQHVPMQPPFTRISLSIPLSLYLSPFSCKWCSSSQQHLPKAGAHLARQESRTRVRTGSVLLQSSLIQSWLVNWKSSWLPFLFAFCFS